LKHFPSLEFDNPIQLADLGLWLYSVKEQHWEQAVRLACAIAKTKSTKGLHFISLSS
jgi:hypothetical protein